MQLTEELAYFPTTRYQGSKKKIIPWIFECTKDLEFDTVLDAFGGSATVSYLFKRMGKHVTYNDILKFNFIIGESIITNNAIKLIDQDLDFILKNDIDSFSFIQENFGDYFYLPSENIWIDNVISRIYKLNELYSGDVLRFKTAIAMNALFQACLIKRPYNLFHRKNLNMRTRDVKRGFGNKKTWETPFETHYKKFVVEINNAICSNTKDCCSLNEDVFNLENCNYDLVYLDSPYIKVSSKKNESADYLKCYHFLEGLARYTDWHNLLNHESNIKCIQRQLAPNHFLPRSAIAVFSKLFEKFEKSKIVLSYKYGGKPSIEELITLLKKYKPHVNVYDKHYKYALNKQNGNAILNREYLIIGV